MMEFDALLTRCTERLGHDASEAGLVDVAVTTVDSPVGQLLLAATSSGLVRVAFDTEDHGAVFAALAGVSPRVVEHRSPLLAEAAVQLADYFAGRRGDLDLPIDWSLSAGPYRREVLLALRQIPSGETRSYAQVAAATGRPGAIRAVGSGCATNPVPLVVPCHRVLRTGGALGGYLGGMERKRWLLDHEARRAG